MSTISEKEWIAPQRGETAIAYCKRLEDEGHELGLIRKGLAWHFEIPLEDISKLTSSCDLAKLRHIQMIVDLVPSRTDYSLTKKVSKNLGISDDEAALLVERFRKTDAEKLRYATLARNVASS